MEILFETRNSYTPQSIRETFHFFYSKRGYIQWLAFLFIDLALFIYVIYQFLNAPYSRHWSFWVYPVVLIHLSFLPLIQREKQCRQARKHPAGTVTVQFCADMIYVSNLTTGATHTYPYSEYPYLKETKNYFVLHNKTEGRILEKHSFTTGTADAFRAFITEKLHCAAPCLYERRRS